MNTPGRFPMQLELSLRIPVVCQGAAFQSSTTGPCAVSIVRVRLHVTSHLDLTSEYQNLINPHHSTSKFTRRIVQTFSRKPLCVHALTQTGRARPGSCTVDPTAISYRTSQVGRCFLSGPLSLYISTTWASSGKKPAAGGVKVVLSTFATSAPLTSPRL